LWCAEGSEESPDQDIEWIQILPFGVAQGRRPGEKDAGAQNDKGGQVV